MNEYEVLDAIYEELPEPGISISLYEQRGKMTRPEMYVTIDGECWRILAERHPHHD